MIEPKSPRNKGRCLGRVDQAMTSKAAPVGKKDSTVLEAIRPG